jgi:F-type H+-transporting ATPase subunit b
MEQTLQALGGILLKAIPTVILLLILHAYLRAVLFAPLEKMLKQRDDLTVGARKAADQSLAAAEAKAAEYEAKLREARAVVYKEQEETRRRWLEDQSAQVAQSRSAAEVAVSKAKQDLAAEAGAARDSLAGTSSALADQIATSLLSGRAG